MINDLPSRALCEKLKTKKNCLAQRYDCSLVPPTLIDGQYCWDFQVCSGTKTSKARNNGRGWSLTFLSGGGRFGLMGRGGSAEKDPRLNNRSAQWEGGGGGVQLAFMCYRSAYPFIERY